MRHDPLPCADRLGRLRSGFPETDALLILNEKNIRYLTGFTGGDGALMAGPDWLHLLVDGRYVTQARDEARVWRSLNSAIGSRGSREWPVGMRSGDRVRIPGPLGGGVSEAPGGASGGGASAASDGFQFLRAVKDEREIDRIREAARIAGEALAAVREMIRPGVREKEIALELEYRMRRGGAEQVSFETIVAAGANSALPHATPGCRAIADGDCVMIDYGAVCQGYHSDETCTYICGPCLGTPGGGLPARPGGPRSGDPGDPAGRFLRGDRPHCPVVSRRGGAGIAILLTAPVTAWGWMSMRRRAWPRDGKRSSGPAWWSPSSRGSISPASGGSGSKIRFS